MAILPGVILKPFNRSQFMIQMKAEKRNYKRQWIEKTAVHNTMLRCNYCRDFIVPGERYTLEYTRSEYEGKELVARACSICKKIYEE